MCQTLNQFFRFISENKELIQLSLIVGGWFFVYRLTVTMKKRDEVKHLCDITKTNIRDIFDLCQKYYEQKEKGHQNFESADIKARLLLLSYHLLLLDCHLRSNQFAPLITSFRKYATGGYFETIEYASQIQIPGWHIEFSSSASDLVWAVDRAFHAWTQRSLYEKLLSKFKSKPQLPFNLQ